MTTVEYVGSRTNGGYIDVDTYYQASGTVSVYAGKYKVGKYYYTKNGHLNFTGVTIPNGSTIDVAYLHNTHIATISDPCPTIIYFEDAANPTTISSFSDYGSRVTTSASVAWSVVYQSPGDSPSIVSIISELCSSYSYASGANMQLLWKNGITGNDANAAYQDANYFTLHIEYTAPGGSITDNNLKSTDRGVDRGMERGTGEQ